MAQNGRILFPFEKSVRQREMLIRLKNILIRALEASKKKIPFELKEVCE